MNEDEFLPVAGFPGYFASADGRVRSRRNGKDVLLKPTTARGYKRLTVILNGRRVKRSVHQLVARAFCGEPASGQHVRHLNGNRSDNRASNLAFGTPSENRYDAVKHGTHNLARKTHCPKGHPYSGSNLRDGIQKRSNGRVYALRVCRTCGRDNARIYRARKSSVELSAGQLAA